MKFKLLSDTAQENFYFYFFIYLLIYLFIYLFIFLGGASENDS